MALRYKNGTVMFFADLRGDNRSIRPMCDKWSNVDTYSAQCVINEMGRHADGETYFFREDMNADASISTDPFCVKPKRNVVQELKPKWVTTARTICNC